MRSIIIAAIAALAFATSVSAEPGASPGRGPTGPVVTGPYTLDANGVCRAASGVPVATTLCKPPAPACNAMKTKPCGRTCIPLSKICRVH